MNSQFSAAPRILDLDGSLTRQSELRAHAAALPLRGLGPHLRYLCTRANLQRFGARLDPQDRHRLTFTGSGDFHHLTAELLRAFREPLSVVAFDQHPDWDITAPWACCGSWVNAALRLPQVKKIVVIGAGEEDLGGWHLLRGNMKAVWRGQLEIYPATWARSKTLDRSTRVSRCAAQSCGKVRWQTVEKLGWDELMTRVIADLPTRRVYVSVDKDCLARNAAVSNWGAGELELDDVCAAIERLGRETEIVGADVTGEWSGGAPASAGFRAIARADHARLARRGAHRARRLWRSTSKPICACGGLLEASKLAPRQRLSNLRIF